MLIDYFSDDSVILSSDILQKYAKKYQKSSIHFLIYFWKNKMIKKSNMSTEFLFQCIGWSISIAEHQSDWSWSVSENDLVNHVVNFDQILHTYLFKHCPATGLQNDD